MKYTLIDRSKAPAPPPGRPSKRAQESNELVQSLTPGKVAKVELSDDESLRGVKASITRAGNRLGKRVRVWDSNGVIYAELSGGEGEGNGTQ